VLGDRLQCPYHGMEFDFNGICVEFRAARVPAGAKIKKYVVVEKWKLIWIWMEIRIKQTYQAYRTGGSSTIRNDLSKRQRVARELQLSAIDRQYFGPVARKLRACSYSRTQEVNDVPRRYPRSLTRPLHKLGLWLSACAVSHQIWDHHAYVDRWHISEAYYLVMS